jgi:acetyltransferase
MFGSGGKYVEYIDDTIIRSAYLTNLDVDEMINKTKIGKIIQGVRGESSADMNKIKNTIKSVAQMMLDHKEIIECDLNPLVVTEDNNIFAVDIRIKC